MDKQTLIAYLANEAGERESRRVAEWRAMAPENEEEFQRLSKLWSATDDFSWPAHDAEMPSARQIIGVANARRQRLAAGSILPISAVDRTGAAAKRRVPVNVRAAAIAASFVLGVGLGLQLTDRMGQDDGLYAREQLLTGVGEFATTTLADGTVVRLAPESRIEFPRTGASRELTLDGRAFFAVAENREPFRIRMSGGEIQVLGTRFDVETREQAVQVTVLEGTVRLRTQGYETDVAAKQVARTVDDGPPEVEAAEDVFGAFEWLGNFLAFESTAMTDVIDEFERRFDIRVELADSTLLDRRVTAWFADSSPEEMMTGICTAIHADCTIDQGTVRMERRSSSAFPER